MRQRRRSQYSQRGLSAGSCSLFAFFILIGTPLLAWATTVIKMSLETVVAEADRIAVCEVIEITTTRNPKTGNPVTRVTFEPTEWWKGDSEERTVTLQFLGGPVGDDTILVVAGMPQYEVGEHHVLFWRDGDEWANPLVGWHQGQYDVIEGEDGELYVEGSEARAEEIAVDHGIDLGAAIAARNRRTVEASGPRTGADEETLMLETVQRALTEHLEKHGGQHGGTGRTVQAHRADDSASLLPLSDLKKRVNKALRNTQ